MGHTNTICFEPFVYTSMASHFGTGYHMVVRGKRFLNKDAQEWFEKRAVDFANLRDLNGPTIIYLQRKDRGILLRVSPLASDWMGRPGTYVSALVFDLADLADSRAGTVMALDFEELPFISHDRAVEIDRKHGEKFERAVTLTPDERPLPDRILRKPDYAWFLQHHTQVISALEAIENGKRIVVDASEPLPFMRWLSLLLPQRRRPELLFAAHGGAGIRMDVSVTFPFPGTEWRSVASSGAVHIKDKTRPQTKKYAELDAQLGALALDGSDIEGDAAEFLAGLAVRDMDVASFWRIFSERQQVKELLETATLTSENAIAYAGALEHLWSLDDRHQKFRVHLKENVIKWLLEQTEGLNGVMSELDNHDPRFAEACREILVASISELIDKVSGVDAITCHQHFDALRAPLEQVIERVLQKQILAPQFLDEFTEAVLSETGSTRRHWIGFILRNRPDLLLQNERFRGIASSLAPDLTEQEARTLLRAAVANRSEELVRWLLTVPELLAHAEPALAPAFQAVRIDPMMLMERLSPSLATSYDWWAAWPRADHAGRQVWESQLIDRAEDLSVSQQSQLIRNLQAGRSTQTHMRSLLCCLARRVTPDQKDIFFDALDRYARFVSRRPETVLSNLMHRREISHGAPLYDVLSRYLDGRRGLDYDSDSHAAAVVRFITSPILISVLVGMLAIVVIAIVIMVSQARGRELRKNLFLTVDGALTRKHIEFYDDLAEVMAEDPVAGWKDFNKHAEAGQLVQYNRQLKNVWDISRNPCKTLDSAFKRTRRLIRVAESVKRDGIPHRHLTLVEAYLGWIGRLQDEGRITVDGTYLSLLATTVPAISESPEKGYVLRHSISGSPEYVTIKIGPEDEDTPIIAQRIRDAIIDKKEAEEKRARTALNSATTTFANRLADCREPAIAAHLELDLEALERRINDSLIGVEVITNQVTIYKEAVQELNSAISSSEARRKSVEDRNAKKAKYEKLYEENRPLLEAYRKECGLSSVEGTFDRAKGEQDPNTAAGLFQSAYSGLVTALANAQAADRDKKEKELAASFNEVKQRYDDALSKVRSLPSTKEQEANLGKAKNLVTQAEGNRDIEKLRNAADLVEEVVKQQEGLRDGYLAAQKLYNEKAKEVSTRRLLSVRGEAAKGKWGQAQSEANAAMQYENRLEGVKRYNTAIALLEEILAEKPDAAKPIEKKEDEEPKLRHKDTTDRVFKRNEKDTSTQTASIKDLTKAAEDARKEREKKKKGWFGKTVGAVGGAVKSTGKMMAAPVVKTKDALVDYKNRDLSFYAAITKIEVEFDRTITNPTDVMVLFSWETGTYTATQRSVDFSGKMKPAESVLEVPGINKLFGMDGRVLDYRIRCTVTLQQSGAKKKFSRTGAWILEGGKFRQGENGDWLDLEMLKKADAKDPNDALAEVSKVRVFVQSRDPE